MEDIKKQLDDADRVLLSGMVKTVQQKWPLLVGIATMQATQDNARKTDRLTIALIVIGALQAAATIVAAKMLMM